MRWQGEWVERVRRGLRHLREGQKKMGLGVGSDLGSILGAVTGVKGMGMEGIPG